MQSFSGSTLIGYITGPSADPPMGVRVIEPPPGTRQHQRGSLYVVVELFGQSAQQEALASRMANVLQRAYYTAKGSQAEVMATGIDAAHQLLQEHNSASPDQSVAAGMLCAALLNGRLLIATSGAAFALVRVGEKVHMFPSEVRDFGELSPIPERIEVFRQDVEPDDVVFLGGGSWLDRLAVRTLASIVAYTSAETCSAAADELYDMGGGESLPGLLMVVGGNHKDTGVGGPREPGGPSAAPGGGSGNLLRSKRPRTGGLPTALSAVPTAARTGGAPGDRDEQSPPGPDPPRGVRRSGKTAIEDYEVVDPDFVLSQATEEGPAVEPFVRETGVTLNEEAGPARTGNPAGRQSSLSSWSRRFLVGAAGTWAAVRGFFARMLPGPAPESAARTEDADIEADPAFAVTAASAAPDLEAAETDFGFAPDRGASHHSEQPEFGETGDFREADAPAATAARAVVAGAESSGSASIAQADEDVRAGADVQRNSDWAPARRSDPPPAMPEMEPFTAPEPARGARARLFILLAVMVVVLAPAVVGGIYLGEAPSRIAEADERTNSAEVLLAYAKAALDLDDRVAARRQLTEARAFLMQAVELDDWTDRRRALDLEIRAELEEVQQVSRLYGLTEPILVFSDDAAPSRLVVMNDEIYVLDGGHAAVYRYRFDPAAGRVLSPEGQPILRQGDTVGNVVVGALHDITWLPLSAGREDKPSLLILDRQNNVFRFDHRVEGVTRMVFGDQSDWGSAAQIETYGGRVYVADEATSQVYRYEAGRYEAEAEPWFLPDTQTSLGGLRDMAIDGDIWFLYNTGMVLRYRDRQQMSFALESGFGFAEEPGNLFVAREGRQLIYVVDSANARILVYNKQGEYQFQLVGPEGDELEGVSALAVDEIAGRMFILTRSALYLHPLVE